MERSKFLRPLMISSKTIPKLNTSLLSVADACSNHSGAKYPGVPLI
eukprot:Gb_16910 [translate_table: standard]